MLLICSIVVSCGLGIVSKTDIKCFKLGENQQRYLVDCRKGIVEYCENENTAKSYGNVLVDKPDCVLLK